MPPEQESCKECGKPLPAGKEGGICAGCLWGDGPEEPGSGAFQLPGLEMHEELARGGMGVVYRARQLEPLRTVAVKMLLPHLVEQPGMKERFRQEAQAMASLDHPGILPVHEVGEYAGLPWFSMKFVSGGSLSSREAEFHGDWRRIAGLVAELADAVHFAHARGVLHRDLKPGNILFDEKGRAYVTDFGLAKFLDEGASTLALTRSTGMIGTPNYLPPEYASGQSKQPTTAGDVYGLGAVLYQLLTGKAPHTADSLPALLRQIAQEPPVRPGQVRTDVPRDMEVICLRCLEKEPSARYAGSDALAQDLRLWLEGRPILARPVSAPERLWRWARRNPALAILSAALVVAMGGFGMALYDTLRTSRAHLHQALVAQARGIREGRQLGHRRETLAALGEAASIDRTPEVRREFISAFAMSDLHEARRLSCGRTTTDLAFNEKLTHMTRVDEDGRIRVVSIEDDTTLYTLPPEVKWTTDDTLGPMSPDGRYVVFRTREAGYSIYDGLKARWSFTGTPQDRHPVFSPDSTRVALGNSDGRVTLRECETGRELRSYATSLQMARPLAFRQDGRYVAVSVFKGASVGLLNLETGETEYSFSHPEKARVRSAAWRADGDGVLVGCENFKVYHWRLGKNPIPQTLLGHAGNVFALAAHPGGDLVASQAWDGTTRLWNLATSEPVATLGLWGRRIIFSADGGQLAYHDSEEHSLVLSDFSTSEVCRLIHVPHPDPDIVGSRGCWHVSFSPDSRVLHAGDVDGVFHYDAVTGALLAGGRRAQDFPAAGADPSRRYCWSVVPDPATGTLFAARKSGVWRYDARVDQSGGRTFECGGRPVFRGDSNQIALAPAAGKLAVAMKTGVHVVDATTGQTSRVLEAEPARFDGVAITGDARLVAASHQDARSVRVWEASTGVLAATLPTAHTSATVLFSQDGRRLFVGDKAELSCFDTAGWRAVWRMPRTRRSDNSLAMSPSRDGRMLAAALDPDGACLLDAATGRELARIVHPDPQPVDWLALSPDSTKLAAFTHGHIIQLWDLRRLREKLAAHQLDWEAPPFAPEPVTAGPALREPPRVTVTEAGPR